MKSIAQVTVALVATLVFVACGNSKKEIERVAKGYIEALAYYRVSDARQYATTETCEVTLNFFDTLLAHTDPQVYAKNMPAEITITGTTIYNDTAASVAYHKSTPSGEQDGSVDLVKRDGKWQVEQVIEIPQMLKPIANGGTSEPRTFTDEEISQMRENESAGQ